MKTLLILFLYSTLFAKPLLLELGQSKKFSISSAQIWIEKSSVLKAEVKGSTVLIHAKNIGESQFRVGNETLMAQVLHPDQLLLFEQLKKHLQTKPGLSVDVQNGQIVINGYLHEWT